MTIRFTKMHGLGNDFAVINATKSAFNLTSAEIRRMADRQEGIGFDQMLILETATVPDADFRYRIFNADGGEAEQCGNGARCMALFIQSHQLKGGTSYRLQAQCGLINLQIEKDGRVRVEMGVPQFTPELMTSIEVAEFGKLSFSEANMGNPHAVIITEHLAEIDVEGIGPLLAKHPHFPQGVNVEFVQVENRGAIQLIVYERGVGLTKACGSGACAAMAVGRRKGLLDEQVMVHQPGGVLQIDWKGGKEPLWMCGPAVLVYEGEWLN